MKEKKIKAYIALGNIALQKGDYSNAIYFYINKIINNPILGKSIAINFKMARKKYRVSRQKIEQQKVAVCSWGLAKDSHQINTLVAHYENFADVSIINNIFSESTQVAQGFIENESLKYLVFTDNERSFIDAAMQFVSTHPYDIIHLYKPYASNVFLGILYEIFWDAKVLVDVDEREFSLVESGMFFSNHDYIEKYGQPTEIKNWGYLAFDYARNFDGITSCSSFFQSLYGDGGLNDNKYNNLPAIVLNNRSNSPNKNQKLNELIGSTNRVELLSLLLVASIQLGHFTQKNLFSDKDVQLIKESNWFDEEWYVENNSHIHILQIDPAKHYLRFGAQLGCNPSQYFNTKSYLAANPDVEKAGVNPLIHYIRSGHKEGRRIALRRRAMSSAAWRKGNISITNDLPSILLCAHEVNKQIFGGERSFIDMLEALSQMKLNIFVTIPREDNFEYIKLLQEKSCGVYSFPYALWSRNRKPDEVSIEDFINIIEYNNISLVYCNTIVLTDPLIAARRLGRLTAVHSRELIERDEHLCKRIGLNAKDIVEKIIKHTDYIIANSLATQASFLQCNRSFHVPNVVNIDLLDIPNQVDETVTFGIISSNIPKKGIADFIEIARRSEVLIPKAHFCVIGPENNYISELKALGVPKNLRFTGYTQSPVEAIKQVNVVLSLSYFAESFGRTIAEAQAARRPVIAYRWGALPELIDEGKTGFLVSYRNIDSVVVRINKLCKKTELISIMGELGREKIIRQFSSVVLRNGLRHAVSKILGDSCALRMDDNKNLTIIIPIYNAPDAVERCLESVLKYTDLSQHRVLMINDGSSNKYIQPLLERFVGNKNFYLLVNKENIGYTRTINRGIKWSMNDDILLLNSDTIVHDGWISGMQKIALGTPKAGTVTAMSDNSGVFSFPKPNIINLKPDDISYNDWAKRIISFTQDFPPISVPTGNGFCLYIRRDLLEHIGLFDEDAFPRGYGEENDFCMRAVKAGWKNFITPHAYVFHQRTASFGAEKESLIRRAMEIIDSRYPSYKRKVKSAFDSSQLMLLRKQVEKVYQCDQLPKKLSDNALVGEPVADKTKYRVGPEKRFVSLSKMMIDWHALRVQVAKRDSKLVSIIVCVYNQFSLTNKCLKALLSNSGQVNIEIIMVNNASDSETSDLLDNWARRDNRVSVIHNFDNLNFALGNNIGFAASKGEKVIFLNNDTEVQRGWLEPLLTSLKKPEVMGAQPKLLYPDGRVQCIGVVFSGKTPLGYPIYVDERANSPLVMNNRHFRAITGACLAMRAVDFALVEGFDPVFINGQEDIDLCYRLGNANNVFEYVAASTVIHHEGRTKGRGRFIIHNRYTFVNRWHDAFIGDDVDFYKKDGFLVTEYISDRPELNTSGISCWRACLRAKDDNVIK